jgi:hypothetical protein
MIIKTPFIKDYDLQNFSVHNSSYLNALRPSDYVTSLTIKKHTLCREGIYVTFIDPTARSDSFPYTALVEWFL